MATTDGGDRPGQCADCGAPLRPRQRYCLSCGERIGPPSAQLQELVHRARTGPAEEPPPQLSSSGLGFSVASVDRGETRRRVSPGALLAGLSGLTLPSPRISGLLVLAFAAFGVLLGSVAGSPVQSSFAASARPRLKLLLPAAAAKPSEQTSSAAVQPPPTAAEATPEAAPVTPQEATTPSPSPSHAPATKAPSKKGKSGGSQGGSPPSPGAPAAKLPPISHVFIVMLSDQPYAATFGPESAAPYLSRTLEKRGALLPRYYAVAHGQLADGIALLSGQGPTRSTAADCPLYSAVAPASPSGEEQVAGDGCVYPQTTATLPGQLEVKRLTWRAYVQGIGESTATPPACAHPALGQADPSSTQAPPAAAYATSRNPFVYFQGLTESPSCAKDDVGFGALAGDLSSVKRTPSLSYIVPDRCHDASPGPCPGGGPGGLASADGLLAQIVPKILASQAYKHGGLLLITSDQAPTSGASADSSSCCGQPRFPNLPAATGAAAGLPPEGGGQVGALLLSPFVKAHTTSQEPYNHYSLLRTIEDLFGLKHLGYAAGAHVSSLEPSLFAAAPAH